jgi:hypothetical protein
MANITLFTPEPRRASFPNIGILNSTLSRLEEHHSHNKSRSTTVLHEKPATENLYKRSSRKALTLRSASISIIKRFRSLE